MVWLLLLLLIVCLGTTGDGTDGKTVGGRRLGEDDREVSAFEVSLT